MLMGTAGWSLLAALLLLASATTALQDCQFDGGQQVIEENCQWKAAAGSGGVVLEGPPAGVGRVPPILLVNSVGAAIPHKATPGQASESSLMQTASQPANCTSCIQHV